MAPALSQSCKGYEGLIQAASLSEIYNTPAGTVNLGSVPELLHAGSQQNVYSAVLPGQGRELVRITGSSPSAKTFDLLPGSFGSYPEVHGEFSNGSVLVSTHAGLVSGRGLSILPVTGQPSPVDTGSGSYVDFSDAAVLGSSLYVLKESEFRGKTNAGLLRIDPNGKSTVIRDFKAFGTPVGVGDVTVFGNGLLVAVEFTNGTGFFKSDGTANGTVEVERIKDASRVRFRGNLGGKALFTMDTATTGNELYITDGTKGGVKLLKDIDPGKSSSRPRGAVQLSSTKILFHADNGTNGREPYVTDGTPNGTVMLKDVQPGAADGIDGGFVVFKGKGWFNGNDGTTGKELWETDGTAAGTKLTQDRIQGLAGLDPKSLCVVNQTMYFSGLDPKAGIELHKTDGTVKGTSLVKDLNVGISSTLPYDLSKLGNLLLFGGMDSARGEELFWSDGTANGTKLAFDLNPAATKTAGSNPGGFTTSLSWAFFSANDPKSGVELFRTDGTSAGTGLVKDLMPGSGGSNPKHITALPDGRVIFSADGGSGQEPYVSDGTTKGTWMLKDIMLGSGSSNPGPFVNGTLNWTYYPATDSKSGCELYRSSADLAKTLLVGDINKGSGSSCPGEFALLPGKASQSPVLTMAADDGSSGREFWGLDLWKQSIQQIKDINQGPGSSNPTKSVVMRGSCFFIANDGKTGDELWKSDGTAAGTMLLKDIATGSTPGLQRFGPAPVVFKDRLFFPAFDSQNGVELWWTDGTSAGTTLFKDLAAGSASATPQNLTVAGDKLFFTTQQSTTNGTVFNLWVSDGTATGTKRVPGAGNVPTRLQSIESRVYYAAVGNYIPFTNQELFVSDGTRRGTFQVADIAPGFPASNPDNFTVVNGKLLFSADDGRSGLEPWVIAHPGPTAEPIGASCGPTLPKLRITPPVPGNDVVFTGTNAPDNSKGVLVLSTPLGAPWKLGDCQVYIDLNTMIIVQMFTPTQGSWSLKVPIPPNSALLDTPPLSFQNAYDVFGRLYFSNAVTVKF